MYNIWSSNLATDWTVRGSNPGGGDIFCTCPDRPWDPPSLLYNGYRVFPGVKAAGDWRWPPTPSSAEVKEKVKLYLYSPSGPSRPVLGWTFTLKPADNISGSMCTPGSVCAFKVSIFTQKSTFQDHWSVYRLQNSRFWSHTATYAICRWFLNAKLEFRPKSFQKRDSWRTKWHCERLLFKQYFCFPLSVPPHQYTISYSFIHSNTHTNARNWMLHDSFVVDIIWQGCPTRRPSSEVNFRQELMQEPLIKL
jgi:hypothetical protein